MSKIINQNLEDILLKVSDELVQKLRQKTNDLTFLKYLITNEFSNNSGEDFIDYSDIIRLEQLLFDENYDKVEKEHILLPIILMMVDSKLNTKQYQDLDNIKEIILKKMAYLKEECAKISLDLQEINKFVKEDNQSIFDYSSNDKFIKMIYSLDIDTEIKNNLLLQIMKINATSYKLENNANKNYIKMNDIEKIMDYAQFDLSLFLDADKEIIINKGRLANIDEVLGAIKSNQLLFFNEIQNGKYKYSHELAQILIESNSDIINNVCNKFLSMHCDCNNLSTMLSVFLRSKKTNGDKDKPKSNLKTIREKKAAINKNQGRLSRRYDYFIENEQFLSSNLSNEFINYVVNSDNNVLIMEPQKLKARFKLFNKYGIQLNKNHIKTFLKLLYSTSSIQLTNMIDRYIELGFDPITNLSYKKGIDNNLSKLLFKFSIDKIYYAKKNGIPVYNDRGNWHYYITINEENKILSSRVFPPLTKIREFIPDYVEQYYNMSYDAQWIKSYYSKLNDLSDDEFNNIDNITNKDIVQRIIDAFESFCFDDYCYYLANVKIYISKPKFIRNLKLLQNEINEQNMVDIVLLCAANNSILNEQEFNLLKKNIEQILNTKKKVL